MENNSDEYNSDSSSDQKIDSFGNKIIKQHENEEQQRMQKLRKMTNRMKSQIGKLFKQNSIGDLLPYNQKIVVINHEMNIQQFIEAMIKQQNQRTAIIWNNEKREYQKILTLRDLLEMFLYVSEKLQDTIQQFENQFLNQDGVIQDNYLNSQAHDPQKSQKYIRQNFEAIIDSFMKKYIYLKSRLTSNIQINELENSKDEESHDDQNNGINRCQSDAIGFSNRAQLKGFELIFKIFEKITVQDWLNVQRSIINQKSYHVQKSELIDMDINSKIIDCIQIINDNNFNVIALASNEKSQLQGLINTHDIITFLANNYSGDIDFFMNNFGSFENSTVNISHIQKNQNLVKANHTENLYEILRKMRDNRVSVVIIERSVNLKNSQKESTEAVGMVFLSDLMYLFRQLNFHEILVQPVMNFIMNLNGTEEDRKAFKEKIKNQGGDGQIFLQTREGSDANSYHTSNQGFLQKKGFNQKAGDDDAMAGTYSEKSINDQNENEQEDFFFDNDNYGKNKKSMYGSEQQNLQKFRKNDLHSIQENEDKNINDEILIDDVFGKIFGIERVHILSKKDRLKDVIEKIQLIPESKLVYIEKNQEMIMQFKEPSFQIHNILTLSDLLTYLCPSEQ